MKDLGLTYCGKSPGNHLYKHEFRLTLVGHSKELDGRWKLGDECSRTKTSSQQFYRPLQCQQVIPPADVTLAYSLPRGLDLLTDYLYASSSKALVDKMNGVTSTLGASYCSTQLFRNFYMWNFRNPYYGMN